MAWIVGVDEAGYGPNLGPFVMTSVACRVPDALVAANLWQSLKAAVCRKLNANDSRVLVEDSKIVYSPTRGLRDLETSVLATALAGRIHENGTFGHCLNSISPDFTSDSCAESWYTGTTKLPLTADTTVIGQAADLFARTCAKRDIQFGIARSVVLFPPRFNQLLEAWGTKGAVLGYALGMLLASNRSPDADSCPIFFFVDKHGGRNNYAAMVQHALPDGVVIATEEGPERSVYRVLALDREVRLSFQPRAETEHFCVALASMVSKYLREVFMHEFNLFWKARVPGIKPTAGYPGDARRFYDEILPAARQLAISDDALWRRK